MLVSLGLFVLACALPALTYEEWVYNIHRQGLHIPGWVLLLWGWAGPVYGRLVDWTMTVPGSYGREEAVMPLGIVAWYANPVLVGSWVCVRGRQWQSAAICALIAIGLALLTLAGPITISFWGFTRYHGVLPGFYLWLASMVVALLGALIGLWSDRASRVAPLAGSAGAAPR